MQKDMQKELISTDLRLYKHSVIGFLNHTRAEFFFIEKRSYQGLPWSSGDIQLVEKYIMKNIILYRHSVIEFLNHTRAEY